MRINDSKGFTIVEMLVAAGLLGLALAGAMSFFVFQSQKGADATRLKVARENLTLALMLIQRDIMAAGYGTMGASGVDPKTLSFVIKANYGVDQVTGMLFNSKDTTTTPDKLHIGYGTFLDMNYDVNGTNDSNSVFKYSAIKNIGPTPASTFIYDVFPVEMAVTTDTRPVGGFICSTCGSLLSPDAADINWQTTGSRTSGTKTWTVKLQSSMLPMMSSLSGNVAPSIVYRIAQDFGHSWVTPGVYPPYELQRNGVRIAGGDPGLEVYNLKVSDMSGVSNLKRSFSIRLDYQVKMGGSKDEQTLNGTAKKTWYKSYVTIEANPRVIMLNGG